MPRYVLVKKTANSLAGLAAATSTMKPVQQSFLARHGKELAIGGGTVVAGGALMAQRRQKQAEQIADELDMTAERYEYLREAPLPQEESIELPWLAPGLMCDDGGVKIAMVRPSGDIEADNARLCERLVKIAAKSRVFDAAEWVARNPSEAAQVASHYGSLPPASVTANKILSSLSAADQAAIKAHLTGAVSQQSVLQEAGSNLKKSVMDVITGRNAKGQMLLAAGIVGGGALLVRGLLKKQQRDRRYANVLGGLQQDPFFENMDQAEAKVPEAYAFMRQYAPTLAQDPTVARGFVRHALTSDETYLSHATASALAEAETKHLGARLTKRDLDDFVKHPLVIPFTGSGKKDK